MIRVRSVVNVFFFDSKKKRGGTEGEGREARTTTTTRGGVSGELCGTAIVILTVVLQKRVVVTLIRVALLDDVSLRVVVGVLALDFLQQRERCRVKCVSDDWAVLVIDEETKHAT